MVTMWRPRRTERAWSFVLLRGLASVSVCYGVWVRRVSGTYRFDSGFTHASRSSRSIGFGM